ncbi:nucleotidyltransferase domain-containing protein [Bdellovibrio bacteriovorus]|uniref:nucleotidyltransferase domain-containing protein n=1 Tax=Bdellovibrio TaxID=958 RepID=UPI0035A8B1B4
MEIEKVDLPTKKSPEEVKQILSDPSLKEIVVRLKEEFNPKRLFLFGSRAYGRPREDSDYDFVVVTEDVDRSRLENLIRASELYKNRPFSVEAFVYAEREFLDWKDEFNSIPELAFTLGIEVPLDDF